MSSSIPSNLNFGSFVPTTFIWEVQQIQSSNIDQDVKELLVRIYQNINQMAIVLNTKDSALYVQEEFVNGQVFFPDPALSSKTAQSPTQRQVFRKVINFGALPNATSKSVAHGITVDSNVTATRIYGAATNPGVSLIPIPYVSTTAVANGIEINMDATNINITTGIDLTAYTVCYVIIEYLKN